VSVSPFANPATLAQDVQTNPDAWIDERARRSLRYFCKRMYDAYEDAPHAVLLIAELERAVETPDSRLIVTFPPRHGKSLHVSEMMPAWYLGKHPDHAVIAASHSQRLANTFSRRVRDKILDPRYPFDVALSPYRSAVEQWELDGHRGGYVAVGVGGSPVGLGGNVLLIDDPIKTAQDANSPVIRDALWEWYVGVFRTRLAPGGSIIVTATRWHEDDPTGRLLAAQTSGGEQWRHLHLPALAMPDVVPDMLGRTEGQALWPGADNEWWPEDRLAVLRQVDEYTFNAQYQGRPSRRGGSILHDTGWRYYHVMPRTVVALATRILLVVDSASKTSERNDYTCIAVWADIDEGNDMDLPAGYYLVELFHDRVEFDDLLKTTQAFWQKYQTFRRGKVLLIVEDKSSGIALIQMLRNRKVPVIDYDPGEKDKIARVNAISGYVNGGLCWLCGLPGYDYTEFVKEHTNFPYSAHDDMVDTTAVLLFFCEINPKLIGTGGTSIVSTAHDGRNRLR
jgi:predicted phage terminase large subunit-like protein